MDQSYWMAGNCKLKKLSDSCDKNVVKIKRCNLFHIFELTWLCLRLKVYSIVLGGVGTFAIWATILGQTEGKTGR